MSLKHIKEALDRLGRTRVDDLGEVDRMMRGALAEVEAIEKAARAMQRGQQDGEWAEGNEILERIAKESSQS